MTPGNKTHPKTACHACFGALLAGLLLAATPCEAQPLILHLHNGDRLTGTLISESTNGVVLATGWNPVLTIPLDSIARREIPATNAPTTAVAVTPAPPPDAPKPAAPAPPSTPPAPAATTAAAAKPQPKAPSRWKTELKLGTDMIRGARDRDIYFGTLAVTYARPYADNPKLFFRNRTDYRADYATTDGRETSDRMFGSNKTDFDLSERLFLYNFMAVGYDDVRRIDLQYEVGPGAGYRLIRTPKFALNLEAGLNYQMQERELSPDIEAWQSRLGQDLTWRVYDRITLSQKATLLSNLEDLEEYQLRFEANLAFGLVKNLSFNLTALDLYDTRPARGVTRNEFQLRSSLGLTF